MRMLRKFSPLMGLAAAGLLLAGCMQPTTYRPRVEGAPDGYTNFIFDTRNTRARTTYQAVPMAPPPDPWWGYRRGFGYWGGFGFAYDPSVDIVTRTNFQAYAEVVLLTPEQAAKEPRSVNANEVIARIGPDAIKPPPAGAPPA